MNSKCSLANPGDEIGYLIWKISKFWQRGKHKIVDEFGLTTSQFELLGAIYHMSKLEMETTQIILSQETYIDPMTTSTILRNLEKKGLIIRRESKMDTRARVVGITESGTEVFEKAITKLKESQTGLFKDIDTDSLKIHLRALLEEIERLNKLNSLNN
ncbi:MAG: MarR family winged helix-turn-helix transcriptional regulator [Prevotella sp.]|jgi:DNA-binding MarR family transcriptional regulator|nr:MarR family winged helix-turn-helix transcriptional regulator [Prevotella sp.]